MTSPAKKMAEAQIVFDNTAFLVGVTMVFLQSTLCAFSSTNLEAVPLLDDETVIRVPAKLAGRQGYLMVDTGSSLTALDRSFQNQPANPIRQVRQILGELPFGTNLQANLYQAPAMYLGKTKLDVTEILYVDLSLLQMITGEPCDGILGMDVLKNYIVSVDFDQKLFAFLNDLPKDIRKSFVQIPLKTFYRHHHQVQGVLNADIVADFLIDTGANSSVSLNAHDWQNVFGREPTNRTATILFGSVGNQISSGSSARLRALELGGMSYSNLICARLANPTSSSSIGLPMLRRHRIILDFPGQYLYLQRRDKSFEDENDMSGLHLLNVAGEVQVHSVDNGSPAALSGILPKDSIVGLDGRKVGGADIKMIRERLRQRGSKNVTLVLSRDGHPIKTTFVLKSNL